jgi:pantoate kinase
MGETEEQPILARYKSVEVWVPHRITGFFQIVDTGSERLLADQARMGSRGGGPSLTAYGKTKLILTPNRITKSKIKIFINDLESTTIANTTMDVLQIFLEYTGSVPYDIEVRHTFDLPSGCGYGASGAGALGTSIAFSIAFNLSLSLWECGKVAHVAEVRNKTGLGTVGGQILGGFSITTKAGYPFRLDYMFVPEDLKVVICSFGPISTKAILTDPEHSKRIKMVGAYCMDQIHKKFDFIEFMKIARMFLKETKLIETLKIWDVETLLNDLSELDTYGASMNMFGKSIFVLCKESKVNEVVQIMENAKPLYPPQVLSVCNHGPLIKNLEEWD